MKNRVAQLFFTITVRVVIAASSSAPIVFNDIGPKIMGIGRRTVAAVCIVLSRRRRRDRVRLAGQPIGEASVGLLLIVHPVHALQGD